MKRCGLGFRGLRDSADQGVGESFFQVCSPCLLGSVQAYKLKVSSWQDAELQVLTGR